MNLRSYEYYDENEYFLKCLKIHPFLIYSDKSHEIKKKEFQLYLLNKYNLKEITYGELKQIYNNMINFELNQKTYLEDIKKKHKEIEKQILETNNNNLYNLYNNEIEKNKN